MKVGRNDRCPCGSEEKYNTPAAAIRRSGAAVGRHDGRDERDETWRSLGRAPCAALVVDRDGRVVARQAWVDPAALRRVLDRMLAAEP
jgi:hypothetical protein